MSALSLLDTIADMEARLGEMRQQLSMAPSYPPGFAPRPGFTRSVRPSVPAPDPYSRGRVPYVAHPSMAVRLQHPQPYVMPAPHGTHSGQGNQAVRRDHVHPHRPRRQEAPSDRVFETVPLSAILQPHETVTLRILLHKDSTNHADLVATFDGHHLVVTTCEWVPSMVGASMIKPGEMLYRFMEELYTAGHLKRMFTVAPWKLCYVARDGVEVTLEELRRRYLSNKPSL